MNKLGIIGAMDMEVEILREKMEAVTETTIAGMLFWEGTLAGMGVVVVHCGVGKVNAAMCAQLLCSHFRVTHLVNTGVAGSLNPELDICDMVVSVDAMHHDLDCTIFGYSYGKVPGLDTVAFPADKTLMEMAFAAAEQVNPGHTKMGRIASGDQFVADQAVKQRIIANTQGACTEMEGAAIAQTAYRNGVPFVILRAISDKADGSDHMDYPLFERIASHHCAEVTVILAKRMANR